MSFHIFRHITNIGTPITQKLTMCTGSTSPPMKLIRMVYLPTCVQLLGYMFVNIYLLLSSQILARHRINLSILVSTTCWFVLHPQKMWWKSPSHITCARSTEETSMTRLTPSVTRRDHRIKQGAVQEWSRAVHGCLQAESRFFRLKQHGFPVKMRCLAIFRCKKKWVEFWIYITGWWFGTCFSIYWE